MSVSIVYNIYKDNVITSKLNIITVTICLHVCYITVYLTNIYTAKTNNRLCRFYVCLQKMLTLPVHIHGSYLSCTEESPLDEKKPCYIQWKESTWDRMQNNSLRNIYIICCFCCCCFLAFLQCIKMVCPIYICI